MASGESEVMPIEVIGNESRLSPWSLGCDVTIEEVDATIQEIRVKDIALSSGVIIEDFSINISENGAEPIDLDVSIVVDGLNANILESQVVPYDKVGLITDLSPESTNESRYAASAKTAKEISESISSASQRIDIADGNIKNLDNRVKHIEKAIAEGGGTGGTEEGYWHLDESDGRLYVDHDIVVNGNAIFKGDTSSTHQGSDPGIAGGFLGVKVGEDKYTLVTSDGLLDMTEAFEDLEVDLSGYYTKGEVDTKFTGMETILGNKADLSELDNYIKKVAESQTIEGDLTINGNLIVAGDTSSTSQGADPGIAGGFFGVKVGLDEYKTVTSDGLLDMTDAFTNLDIDLTNYYTKEEVNSKIDNLNLSQYAKASDLSKLQGDIDNIESVLGMDEEAAGIINTWNEVKAFLDGYSSSDDLAAILSTMNADIAKRALDSDLTALTTRVKTEEDITATYKSWWDDLKSLIVKDGTNNIKINGNLIVAGDTSTGGTGSNPEVAGTLIGIKVNGQTYDNPVNGILTIPDYPTSLEWSAINGKPTKLTEFTNDAGFITSAALNGYATQSWVEGNGYITGISSSMIASALGSVNNGGKVLSSTGGGLGWISLPTTLPASDVYAWAKKSSLALVDVPDLSSKYLPLSGGTITGNLTLNQYLQIKAWAGYGSGVAQLWFDGDKKELQWQGVEKIRIGANIVLHEGNYSSYAVKYLGGSKADDARHSLGLDNGSQGSVNLPAGGGFITMGHDSYGAQLLGSYVTERLHFRSLNNNSWGTWKTVAFTDSDITGNAGSATKLQTARTIWGQSFDGTGDVSGDFNLGTGSICSNSGHSVFIANTYAHIGYGSSANGYDTYVDGNNIYLRYGTSHANGLILNSSGNATFGASDTASSNHKLRVDGLTYLYTNRSISGIDNALAIGHVVDGSSAKDKGVGITLGYAYNQYYSKIATVYESSSPDYLRPALAFYTMSNSYAAGSEVERMRIASNGNVLIGTTTDSGYKLDVNGNSRINGNLVVAGDTSTGSDIRFKDKLSDHRIALSDIANAPLFTFKWNDREDDSVHLGTSAQYWENVAPWLVKGSDFKTLDYSTLGVAIGISLANKAVNHEERIKILEKENKALKEQIRRIQYGS